MPSKMMDVGIRKRSGLHSRPGLVRKNGYEGCPSVLQELCVFSYSPEGSTLPGDYMLTLKELSKALALAACGFLISPQLSFF